MDKSWMSEDRMSKAYEDGVEQFIEFAVLHSSNPKLIRCPCLVCGYVKFQTPKDTRNHMYRRGVDQSYVIWDWHGEGDVIWDEGLYETFGFVNPAVVSLAGLLETHKKQEERSRNIADRLQKAKKNQLILVPYNPGFHWVLAVIDLSLMTAYYIDSLRGDITGDLRTIVDNGVRIFHAQKSKQKRVNLKWIAIEAPIQPGLVECGYYVMRYMKDIIVDRSLLCKEFNGKSEYTEDEMNQVRSEWTAYATQFL